MSTSIGPRIVRDSLLISLDQQSPKSYHGPPGVNFSYYMTDAMGATVQKPHNVNSHSSTAIAIPGTGDAPYPPIKGMNVWKIWNSIPDNYSRFGTSYIDIATELDGYDKTYVASIYVWIPSASVLSGTSTNLWSYQNSTGVDWHGTAGYNATYDYWGAGSIMSAWQGPDITKRDVWQRLWIRFTPTTANITYGSPPSGSESTKATFSFRPSLIGSGSESYLYVAGGQIELGLYPTRLHLGDRGTTNAFRDLSGNGNHLNTDALGLDDYGQLQFTGSNQQQTFTNNASIENATDDGNSHTYECWFKSLGAPPDTYGGYPWGRKGFHTGIGQNKTTPENISITVWQVSGSTNLGIGAGTYTIPDTSKFSHHVIVVDEDQNKVFRYVNGSLFATASISWPLREYGTALYSYGGMGTYQANGVVDQARFYGKALTADEVRQNFEQHRKRYGV